LYFSPVIIKMIKAKRMRSTEYVRERFVKPERKRIFVRPRHRWEDMLQ